MRNSTIDDMLTEICHYRMRDILSGFIGLPVDEQTRVQLEHTANTILCSVIEYYRLHNVTNITAVKIERSSEDPCKFDINLIII